MWQRTRSVRFERAVFVAVLAVEPDGERAACLRETCRGDSVLLTRVEALLDAHEEISRALDGDSDKPAEDDE